eukprot:m.39659 g.39659  ORF g.39659 m.39659 type:complete len:558 (-) comp13724_c0_seq2:234-1907(-)
MDETAIATPPVKKRRIVGDSADVEGMERDGAAAAACSPHLPPSRRGRHKVNRTELVRLLTQSLQDLGYSQAAGTLEAESGFPMEMEHGSDFRAAILTGDWNAACALFDALQVDSTNMPKVKFAVLEQKYLELLERRELKEALYCLREEMSPLQHDVDRLHMLCGLVMCRSVEDVKVEAEWKGIGPESRDALLASIQRLIPTDVMMPSARLRTLLDQAWLHQCQSCEYHNLSTDAMALLEDHSCPREAIPRYTRKVLRKHDDEVWFIAFSKSGRLLASASKDGTAIIWNTEDGAVVHRLTGHGDAVCYLDWSPDGTQILTCGSDDDPTVKLWSVETGACIRTFSFHKKEVTSCAWCPDGKRFVSGSTDMSLCLWGIDGRMEHTWAAVRASDLAVSADGRRLVVACHSRDVHIYNLETREMKLFTETSSITSLSLSADGTEILLNLSSAEVHTWSADTCKMLRKYHGHEQGRYQIRSCFGGAGESFVASGSEDKLVYLWHRRNQTLLEKLGGHARSVNCVAWHPTNTGIFASASDDTTIRLWGTQDPAAEGASAHGARE